MKKVFIVLLTLLVLVGCSNAPSTEPTTVQKACSLSEEGVSMTMTATAQSEEADVDTITMSLEASYESMGMSGIDLTDEMNDALGGQMEASLIASAGFEDYEEYVEIIKSEFNDDGMVFELSMDVASIKEAGLIESEDISLDSYVSSMEASGMTCN